MASTVLLVFAATALVLILTPGPTVLLALSNGLNHGFRPALFGVAGAIVSDVVLIAAVFLGMGALLAVSEVAFQIVKWCGVAYLFYLGISVFRNNGAHAPAVRKTSHAPSGRILFLKSLLVALSNPKGLLFFSAFLPQFVDPVMPQFPQYLTLGTTFAAIDCIVTIAYAAAGARAAGFLHAARAAKWLNRSCGMVLIGMSAALAFYKRTER